jgi:DNA topoisomerase-1
MQNPVSVAYWIMEDIAAVAPVLADPRISAKVVGLRYVSDRSPGIERRKYGETFTFLDPSGKVIRDKKELARIKSLGIPPAWTRVWICPDENGHLQAVGRDAKGRKQYRYHTRWREVRDETKYTRMILFAKALPKIRQRVHHDLKLPELSRRQVLATVVRLLELSLIRVGNEEYAKQNNSFGLTTMRDRHVKVNGNKVKFAFRGKSGKNHEIHIEDKRLARSVKKCQDLPGQVLFQYIDREGQKQKISSEDVNEYLREISGQDFTAKDFRTWAGTVLAAIALHGFDPFDSTKQAKRNITHAIESVSQRLGNTPAICRKCYVHPAIFESYLEGQTVDVIQQRAREELNSHKLRPDEQAVLKFLSERLKTRRQPLAKLLKKSIVQAKAKLLLNGK